MTTTLTKHESPMPNAYDEWLRELDGVCHSRLSLSLFDLPDMLTRDAFDEGTTPAQFFEETAIPTLLEEYGSLVEEILDATRVVATATREAQSAAHDLFDLSDEP